MSAQDPWQDYRVGDYQRAMAVASEAIDNNFQNDESWILVKAKSQLAIGQTKEAAETIGTGLEKYPTSIRIRWVGIEVARMNNQPDRVRELRDEIQRNYNRSSWRYRGPQNQIVYAQSLLADGRDAKEVLTKVLNPVKNDNLEFPDIYLAIGNLAIQKYDSAFAAECFAKAVELEPKNPDAQFGLALAYRNSNSELATQALNAALELNPLHAPSRLLAVDQLINGENYEEAEAEIVSILETNPLEPDAWAYRAVIANLKNQPELEGEYRNKALAGWENNPHIDYLIGQKLSQKYRFKEAVKYERRALIYDPSYIPAKLQLAHDLLRLGDELEGWKVADEVFDEDPYSVVAFNLVTLRDNLAEFDTIQTDGFVIRMSKQESQIYGQHVVELLQEARKTLCEKYQVELETPIFIEIFPEQKDFAIRTFGLPGGAGFLGVCFGRVVTMNSPAAQGSTLTNWKSVLWHEFCHVVTLQKTKNRMPRWLSEGISVYEERKKNPAWGQSMNPNYRHMVLGDDHTTISELSNAFLTPKSPAHLDLAYFEASLAIEFLVQEFGEPALTKILDELGVGVPIDDALRRHAEPVNVLDKKFDQFVAKLANDFASEADLEEVELPTDLDLGKWSALLEANPRNRILLLGMAAAQTKAGLHKASNETIDEILAIYPHAGGIETAYQLQAKNFRELGESESEVDSLSKLVSIDASNVSACTRLVELAVQSQDWKAVKKYARELLAINPLIKSPHRYLAMAAEQTEDDLALIQSLSALVNMQPLDAADTHYRLAAALDRQGNSDRAKRHTLMALEIAPRYQDAHRLLIKLTGPSENADADQRKQEIR